MRTTMFPAGWLGRAFAAMEKWLKKIWQRREAVVFNAELDLAVDAKLLAMARATAAAEGLDATLVCAVVEQESGWNTWAIRYEPLFFAKYVAPLYTNNKVGATEAYARGFSWGLMQVMGQTARERGLSSPFLSALCDPGTGLAVGCRILKHKLDAAGGDARVALLAWNGGGNADYAAEVLARRARYA